MSDTHSRNPSDFSHFILSDSPCGACENKYEAERFEFEL